MKAELIDVVGANFVTDDPLELRKCSNDIFFWEFGKTAELMASPADAAQVAKCIETAARCGAAISIRGGGMSYSAGYVPTRPKTLILDMRRLQSIRELNTQDRYDTVEAGATWEQLTDGLDGTGLRTNYRPPFSGQVSTVGGAISQGSVDAMTGILGVEVVTGRGELVRTGSAARRDHASPFFRPYGPDLAGLFIADCGRLGVKTAVTLELQETPPAVAFASFAFDTLSQLLRSAGDCMRSGCASRVTGLDPVKTRNAPKVGFREAIKTLTAVARENASVAGGMQDDWRLAASGGNFLADALWSLHITSEGIDQASAEAAVAECRRRCEAHGREVPNLLPMALYSRPYSVRGFLGPQGERWVPSNALFRHSDAAQAAEQIQRYFKSQRAAMEEHGIHESYIVNAGTTFVLIEPSFYWQDEVSALHLEHLDKSSARRFATHTAQPDKRAFAKELRRGLMETMDDCGAVHVQLGKYYSYAERVEQPTLDLLNHVRRYLDPDSVLNDGNLGLTETPSS